MSTAGCGGGAGGGRSPSDDANGNGPVDGNDPGNGAGPVNNGNQNDEPAPDDGGPLGPLPGDPCDDPGVICTVVGNGISAFNGDGRLARQTSLYFPLDISFDLSGQPLVLDWNNLRLRRVNEDDTVTTIMGSDFEATAIEGALAIDTALHHSSDIDVTPTGEVYVAGNHSAVIFRVGTDNRVRIVAGTDQYGSSGDGGPATLATLNTPYGVVSAVDGSIYISDVAESVIRRVDADGIIMTVAGNRTSGYSGDGGPATQAQIFSPTRMRVDGEGNLYFCDTTNSAIRRVDGDGIITTVAGTGAAGYTGDGGPASEAQLASPYDMLFGPDGELYVADTGNGAVRRIDRDGTISTVVGTGEPGFAGDGGDARACQLDGPSGLALAADGSLWIADTYNNRVRRVARFLE